MKKILVTFLVLVVLSASVFANGAKEANEITDTIRVGATPDPHGVMLSLVVDDLAAEGYTLEVVEFTDYVTPNEALQSGEIDANFFQHLPYLESFNAERGYNLVSAGGIHIEPLALYSKTYSSLDEIPEGAMDIVDNPKDLDFREIEAATLPRILEDVDAAVINGNYAIPAGLIATRDGLYVEGADSPYVNVIAVQPGNEESPAIQALVSALKSDKVKDYVAQRYPNGEVVLVD